MKALKILQANLVQMGSVQLSNVMCECLTQKLEGWLCVDNEGDFVEE